MPIFDFTCKRCGKTEERFLWAGQDVPLCCGEVMTRIYSIGKHVEKYSPPLWVGRIEEIHKAQEQKGERLRMVYPKEVRAS